VARVDLTSLPGWAEDDHAAALTTYRESCASDDAAWQVVLADARQFFEDRFLAEAVSNDGHLTGYYEPELAGALHPDNYFSVPLHGVPEGWEAGDVFATRAEIADQDLLLGRELVWVADPLEAFLLQVQGSGRILLPDGTSRRLGYAGKNGQPYVSLGKLLVARGEIVADAVSVQAIRDWFAANGENAQQTLRENPSYVFFQWLEGLDPAKGPLGTMRKPLTAMRSIAVDLDVLPLGSLTYIIPSDESIGPRLCVAQDTGGAIKGEGRGDLFCGTGDAAGALAGSLNTPMTMLRLVRRDRAT